MERHRKNTRAVTEQLLRTTTEIRDVLNKRSIDRWRFVYSGSRDTAGLGYTKRHPRSYFAFFRDASTPDRYWYMVHTLDIDAVLSE